MAWNMPQFLEIHITIEQHRIQNKCQAFFISAQWNSFCPIQMQMQAPMTEMIKDVMLPVA